MKKCLAKLALFLLGWKIYLTTQRILTDKKYLLIAAPHTSSMDFILGKLIYLALGKESKFFIKKESFQGLIKNLLIALGGIPIDRNSPREAVKIAKRLESEDLIIILTPEGTRKATNHWHNGFYSIAKRAKTPVFIGVLDYGKKTCTLGPSFQFSPDFNFEEDMKQLSCFYSRSQAKYPVQFLHHGEAHGEE
ncbi:MAG: 1-acyl-sn-glycerol-3-phosphate acyltransferase [Candidatus Peribacteria bacterium]|jgi:1-acyl-sn-glycerol-3-phosphate acyltransferase|nr:1-acyl-sn-glycerol-3-phosphate acyltransferase [Candidatus Peribacteria bacterium]